jgi:hypothetical protein
MFHALSWFIVLSLLALWSLGAWALHAITLWSTANVGALSGHSKTIEDLTLPAWLSPWLPAEWLSLTKSVAASMMSAVDAGLALVPSLGGGLSLTIWVLWGLGSVLLLLLGAAMHALIAMLGRRPEGRLALR